MEWPGNLHVQSAAVFRDFFFARRIAQPDNSSFCPCACPHTGRALAGHGANVLEGCANDTRTCFRCGGQGHWASECPAELEQPPLANKVMRR